MNEHEPPKIVRPWKQTTSPPNDRTKSRFERGSNNADSTFIESQIYAVCMNDRLFALYGLARRGRRYQSKRDQHGRYTGS